MLFPFKKLHLNVSLYTLYTLYTLVIDSNLGSRTLRFFFMSLVVLSLLISSVAACSSWVTDCSGDHAMVMNGRTMDFGGLDITEFASVFSVPAGSNVNLTASKSASDTPSTTAKYAYSFTGTQFLPEAHPLNIDGINSAGLAIGALWQSNVTFHSAPNRGSDAVFVFDLGDVLLSQFSTVDEVREWLRPEKVQLTTQVFDEAVAFGLNTLFGVDPDIPKATDGNVFFIGLHFHVTDATGDSILIEATENGSYALYDTKVVTNEPAWPQMAAELTTYDQFSFSDVPGVPKQSDPADLPLVIPFNSARDSAEDGYFGSMSRNIRLQYQIAECQKYPWIDEGWSPGFKGLRPPQGLGPKTFRTLKRVENYMSSIVVPRSQLVGSDNNYATLFSVIKDNTHGVYYYRTPRDNMWTVVDARSIDDHAVYPIEPQNQPFFVAAKPLTT